MVDQRAKKITTSILFITGLLALLISSACNDTDRLVKAGWNKPTHISPIYVMTSDLNERSLQVVKDGVIKAQEYLGNYGPLKVFIIGTDLEAANVVAKEFCEWTYEGKGRIDECFYEDQGIEIRELAKYKSGSAYAETDGRQLSIPTRAVTIGNPPYDDPNDIGGYKVAIHEYTHIYQHAHISDEDDGMPNWLEEGSAELLAMFLAGKYEDYLNDSVKLARQLRENHPDLTIKDLENERSSEKLQRDCQECYWRLQSETGSLATVLLINQTSMDYFFKEYIPSIFYLGKEKAFENSFGFTIDEFYVTFEEFLNLTESEQLEILKLKS